MKPWLLRTLTVTVAVALAGSCASATSAATSGSWHLVYSDHFTGLRSAKWTRNWLGSKYETTKPPNSYQLAAMAPRHARFTASGLVLTPTAYSWRGYPYRSGDITGYRKQAYRPPLMAAARLYLPCTSTGRIKNWPSFWLVGDPYQWPQDGEVDVVEGMDGAAYYHVHYLANGTAQGPGGRAVGHWCGWHTFRVIWHADGTVVWRYDSTWVGKVSGYAATSAEFPVLMYSMAKPGTYSECPPACSGPRATRVHMRVRWLRIWRWW